MRFREESEVMPLGAFFLPDSGHAFNSPIGLLLCSSLLTGNQGKEEGDQTQSCSVALVWFPGYFGTSIMHQATSFPM